MSTKPTFKTYATNAELAKMDRDLTFHPSTVENPKLLTKEQIARFNKDGYITGLNGLSADELARFRVFVDDLIGRIMAKGGSSYSVNHAHMKYGAVWDLITHPRITAYVRDVLGEDVIGWGAHFFCKMPGDGKTIAWHQDASYWPLTPSKSLKGLSAWLATGGEIQNAFDAVIDCGMGHFLASSVEINAPEGTPGDGVVMFSQCKLDQGADPMKAVEAHKILSRDMRSLGAKNSNWAFFPMLGGGNIDFDYWAVSTFKSWQDYSDAYEIYVNGGGWQKFAQHLGSIATCNDPTPTVWNVKLVRKGNGQR